MVVKGKSKGETEDEKIHKRARWLSTNVFTSNPIDDEAVAAMQGMGIARAMELFKEIEEKSGQVKNPSGYLKGAARRDGFGPPEQRSSVGSKGGGKSTGKGKGASADYGLSKVEKRVKWLNSNIFRKNPIDDQAMEKMESLDFGRAMEIFKDVESKGDTIKNPSSYLISACKREGQGLSLAIGSPVSAKSKGKGKSNSYSSSYSSGLSTGAEYEKIEKRASWLNKFVFSANPIDSEAIAAMKGMGIGRAMELFKEIEEKSDRMWNPSGYLKKAAARDGFAPPDSSTSTRSTSRAKPNTKGQGKGAGVAVDKVQKRASWLNNNVFTTHAIDSDSIATMQELDVGRAMEIFKDLESKADEIKNPSAYLIAAVKREYGGQGIGTKRNALGGGPPAKRARFSEG